MHSYLLAADFDGTLFDTFSISPNAIAFPQAYEAAFRDVFGPSGRSIYHHIGGQQDRATDELVTLILEHGPREELEMNARTFLEREGDTLQTFVSDGEGAPLEWDEKKPVNIITELITRQKIRYLTDEIGTQFPDGKVWPQPIDGLIPFLDQIAAMNRQSDGEFRIDTGVISAGHDMKVIKAFDIWDLPQPTFIISDDDVRARRQPAIDFPMNTPDPELNARHALLNTDNRRRRKKPGELPFALLHQDWLSRQGLSELNRNKTGLRFNMEEAVISRQKIMFFGDDPIMDGGLARGARVPFGLIRQGVGYEIEPDSSQIIFSDWGRVGEVLSQNTTALREGRPFTNIFFGNSLGVETHRTTMIEGHHPGRRER